ncbi:MAG: hypothetical protein H0V00_04585 [Chloroflexia bacterium]|nr:hypothetical protein [Chloroflexia bacterium]
METIVSSKGMGYGTVLTKRGQNPMLLCACAIASAAWIAGATPFFVPPVAGLEVVSAQPPLVMTGSPRQADQPAIQQVGEGTGQDAENLDDGEATPLISTPSDQETLDNKATPETPQGDTELLDQGTPYVATDVSVAPVATTYAAPSTETTVTYVEPASPPPAGPVVPAGFGTGQVLVAAGQSTFPAGLGECHVGVVTGRAYVGIDCGEGTSVVGHAPTYQDFPFYPAVGFPFEGDESFFTQGADFPFGNEVGVEARQMARHSLDDESPATVSETRGRSSVEFSQRSHKRNGRARNRNRDSRSVADSGQQRPKHGSVASERSNDGSLSTESTTSVSGEQQLETEQVAAGATEKKSKKAKGTKKPRERRAQRNR